MFHVEQRARSTAGPDESRSDGRGQTVSERESPNLAVLHGGIAHIWARRRSHGAVAMFHVEQSGPGRDHSPGPTTTFSCARQRLSDCLAPCVEGRACQRFGSAPGAFWHQPGRRFGPVIRGGRGAAACAGSRHVPVWLALARLRRSRPIRSLVTPPPCRPPAPPRGSVGPPPSIMRAAQFIASV